MIIYLVKSILLLGLLYGVYKLFLENEKIHRFNRFYLLFALVFGLTAPLISFDLSPETSMVGVNMQQLERVVNAPAEAVSRSVEPLIVPQQVQETLPKSDNTPVVTDEPSWSISILDLLLWMYGAITLFLLIRFVTGLIEIRNKVKAGTHKKADHATLVLLDEPITPQSFLDYIFLEKKQFELGKIEPEILDHELTHVRHFHSFDVLLIEFLKVIFWFNPLMNLYKHAIQLNHEFMADEAVVRSGSAISEYQELLIRVSAGNTSLKTTSSINFSLTKKRFKMMVQQFSPLRSYSKKVLLLPVLIVLTLMFCTTHNENDYPFKVTGNNDALYSNVELYLNPDRADELGIEERGTGIMFDKSGTPFTGTQKMRYVKNDSLFSETVFVDGVRKSTTAYHEDGSLMGKYEFGYVGEQFKATKHYNENGLLVEEWLSPTTEDGLGSIKQWHPNGQLKFEMTHKKGMEYHGLMTKYNDDGEIIEQERYEDGELVEKIE